MHTLLIFSEREREERRLSMPPLTCSSHCCIIKQHCGDVLAPQVTSTLMYSQILTSRVTFNRTRERRRGFIRARNPGGEGTTARRLSRKVFFLIVPAISSEFYIPQSSVPLYERSAALILSRQFVCDHNMLVIRPGRGDYTH